MSRSPFGWDLPPGCTQRHIDEAFGDGGGVTDLEEKVLGLLEAAGIPEAICDQILTLIMAGEAAIAPPEKEHDDEQHVGYRVDLDD
jgi:hypothetical protein